MDLTPLMKPKSIAVVGASERRSEAPVRMNRSTRVIANLQRFGYGGRIFPINPKYEQIRGLPCYPDLASTPEPADTVVVAIPAEHVPGVLTSAVDAGVRGAVILSSGFGEAGTAGRERQAALERLAADRGLLICGPNCYGVFNIRLGSATFSADVAEPLRPGRVAIVSQSGGFSHAIAEHLMQQRSVGLSYIVSCGNQAGVSIEDYVEFLVQDEETSVVGVFAEGLKQPDKLRRVATRAKELRKPIVVLKVGRSEGAQQAMLAHTGSLAGTPEIADALLKQSGIVQVTSLNEMLDTLTLLAASTEHRRGWRVGVLSGLGGECGRLSDVADRVGLELPSLSPSSAAGLKTFMPDFANPRNPLDGTGAMYEDGTLFPKLLDVMLHEDTFDVVAVNLRVNVPKPGGWAPSREFTKAIVSAVQTGTDRLVVCFNSFAGADLDQEVVRMLADHGVPFLESTETAMLALRHAREYGRFLDRPASDAPPLSSTSPSSTGPGGVATSSPGTGSWAARHGVLSNADAMRLLGEFGIPLVETLTAADDEQTVRAAEGLGYPVVLKIDSPDIAHKSDVGGVRVGCSDAATVQQAYREMIDAVRRRAPSARIDGVLVQRMVGGGTEMIVGLKRDPVFGPAVVCGFGGILVEVLRDVSVRVPPISATDAREMLAELRGSPILSGVRGRARADVDALAMTLVKLAALATAHRDHLKGLDLNPVLVLPEGQGVVAVDWLIELA